MRIGRTIAPVAAPIFWTDLMSGLRGWCAGDGDLLRFENEIKFFLEVNYCFLVSSGKTALALTLQALHDIHPDRDEVLIPAYICYSVPSAIVHAGLKVRLSDIHPDTLDFDFDQLKVKLESKRLLCIIPNHLFGRPADIDRLRSIINDPQVTIVEDAAQAFGGQYNQKKLGTIGDVGVFSLGRGKALSLVEGGIVVTNSDDIAKKIERRFLDLPPCSLCECLRVFLYALTLTCLLRPGLFWIPKALPFLKLGETIYDPNFKSRLMSSFQAGMSKGWKQKLLKFQGLRNRSAEEWVSIMEVRQQKHYHNKQSNLIRFPWQINPHLLREEALRKSELKGLGISTTYPDSIDGIPELSNEFNGEQFPVARKHAQTLVSLPVHSLLNEKDRAKIKQIVFEVTETM